MGIETALDRLEKSGKEALENNARAEIVSTYCAAAEQTSDRDAALGIMQSMVTLRQKHPKINLDSCMDQLDRIAAKRHAENSMKFTLIDDTVAFKALGTPDMQVKSVLNTIDLILDGPNKEEASKALAKHLAGLQRDSSEYKSLKQHIQETDLPPRVLKILAPYFQDVANTKLQQIRTGVKPKSVAQAGQQYTPMLEGCAAIADQQKKTACFESVMELSKNTQSAPVGGTAYTKFDGVHRAATALKSATDVGVTFIQYMPYVQQLATEVQLVKAMNNNKFEAEAINFYEMAIEAYQDAHTFWSAWIDFYSRRDNELTYFGGLPIAQTSIGWVVNKYSIPTTRADLLGIWVGVPKATALTTIWRKAEEYIQKGNEEI